jgi:predicted P-loop ATPase
MQLEQMQHLDPATAKKIVDEVYDRNDIDLSKVANDPDQLIQSLIQWININYPMKRNVITGKIEESGSELSEQRTNTIYLQARIAFNSKEVNKQLIESIINSEMVFDFNPITDFIDKNRHRNTTGNVDKLVKCIRTVTPNYETFLKKWLVSIVAAYDGNPVRSVLALTGGQNSGKTEFFRWLLPGELSKYYAESKLDSGKDDELLMCQKLIVMDDEMGGKSKQDSKRFKELTSKDTFSLRAAYGRHNMDYKRLAILCGTSNDPNVINDPTGNTRILPIEILSIDHEMYNSIDKSELFMELVRMYEVGYDWQLSKDEMIDLSIVSSEFEQTPYEKELIIQIFKHPNEGGYVEFLSSTEIKQAIEGTLIGQKIMNFQRFNIELSKIFGKSEIKRVNGQSKRCYAVTRVLQTKHVDNQEVPF